MEDSHVYLWRELMWDQVEFLMKLGFEFLNVSVCYGYGIPNV